MQWMAKGKVVCHKVLTVMMIPSCKSCEKNSYKKKKNGRREKMSEATCIRLQQFNWVGGVE